MGFEEDEGQGRATWFRDAVAIAHRFLRRFPDPVTASLREDLTQQSAVAAVARLEFVRDRGRFPAYVRTVARRTRAHALRASRQRGALSLEADRRVAEQVHAREPAGVVYAVSGTWVERCELLRHLPRILAQLPPLNERLLMSYYEGFSCAELAERYSTSIDNVKVRIHRSRRRVKELFENRVRPETGELRESPRRVAKER